MTKLIIIRGNSGSGKSTIAKRLKEQLADNCLLVQQDVVRRDMLGTKDTESGLPGELIENIAAFGIGKVDYVILEGIFSKRAYGDALRGLACQFNAVYPFYFDLPFEETVKRHQSKGTNEFGEEELRKWFLPHDFLGLPDEQLICEVKSEEEIIETILQQITGGC
jgi:predicted kinase